MKLWLNRVSRRGPAWLGPAWRARAARALAPLSPRAATVSVVVVDDREIRRLNRRYRHKDRPTDVLSFSYRDSAAGRAGGAPIGDVFVSLETLARDARRLGVEPRHLALRIVVHGCLHVLGYDHTTDAEADRMERRERAVLRPVLPARVLRGLFADAKGVGP